MYNYIYIQDLESWVVNNISESFQLFMKIGIYAYLIASWAY
jgi:hypothetical protein